MYLLESCQNNHSKDFVVFDSLEDGKDVSIKAGQKFTFTTDQSVVGDNERVARGVLSGIKKYYVIASLPSGQVFLEDYSNVNEAKEIANKLNMLLNTEIDGNTFIQILTIEGGLYENLNM